ncbi:hypothetical protein [Paenibacillus sp. NPDC058174]|uniref:hypothetical protein n=1 Tax=Paenibacillus sp. NPDC058174 TaxID=3346366 RepID=UPI0036DD5815
MGIAALFIGLTGLLIIGNQLRAKERNEHQTVALFHWKIKLRSFLLVLLACQAAAFVALAIAMLGSS